MVFDIFPCSILLIILENAFGLLPRVCLFCECCVELIDKNEIRRRDMLNDGALKSLREVFRAKKSDDELTNMKDHQLWTEWENLKKLYDTRIRYLDSLKSGNVAYFLSKIKVCILLHVSFNRLTQNYIAPYLYCTIYVYCLVFGSTHLNSNKCNMVLHKILTCSIRCLRKTMDRLCS